MIFPTHQRNLIDSIEKRSIILLAAICCRNDVNIILYALSHMDIIRFANEKMNIVRKTNSDPCETHAYLLRLRLYNIRISKLEGRHT